MNMNESLSETIKTPKPRQIYGFTIDRETLEHLPQLHKIAAECAIASGRWHLV